MNYIKHGTLATLLLLSANIHASADTQKEFKQVYQAYQQAVAHKDDTQKQLLAEQAYQLGQEIYGAEHQNTLNLAANYAEAMPSKMAEERVALYKKIVTGTQKLHGEASQQLIDPLISLTEATVQLGRRSSGSEFIDSAIAIAQKKQDLLLESKINFEAAKIFFEEQRHYRKAKRYLKRTDELNSAHLPANALHRLEVDMWVAAYETGRKRHNEAIERLNNIVNVFDENLDFEHPMELFAHSRLVAAYERVGNSEAATKHCVAIAKMRPWNNNIEQTPLYRQAPIYPRRAAEFSREGFVQLEFTVTPSGFVEDILVLNPDENIGFQKPSIKALKQWRYAPKFVDGKAVPAKSTVQIDFRLND
ncbi:energy transducer TonB [Pseudoalteromonas aurantia]|uniref:Protein TonB n=1 Tax=Pseudoalteromonas aurantia 208 TaxID=1314867 RepID=A0ABR9ECV1_9GAMM|nr:energy transducer TonB [Pseudoalteromonas aurantia]MBE0368821.1 hypothetical protein [Pseudoalteromonas aurantia 208]